MLFFNEDGSQKQCSGCSNPSCDGGQGAKKRCRTNGEDGVFFAPELNTEFYSGKVQIPGPPPLPKIETEWCHWINYKDGVLSMDVSKGKNVMVDCQKRKRNTPLPKSRKQKVLGEFIF